MYHNYLKKANGYTFGQQLGRGEGGGAGREITTHFSFLPLFSMGANSLISYRSIATLTRISLSRKAFLPLFSMGVNSPIS